MASGRTATINAPATFRSIQFLRGIAALMVVVYHCNVLWAEKFSPSDVDKISKNLSAGVDIFFVISGFVIVISSRKILFLKNGWRQFLAKRFARVAPFYWLMTTLKITIVLIFPSIVKHAHLSFMFIFCSFIFVPHVNEFGEIFPVIPEGWTLNYEVLFYTIFSIALIPRKNTVVFTVIALILIAAIGLFRSDDWPAYTTFADSIVVEFLFGIAAASLIAKGFSVSGKTALLVVAIAFAIILTCGTGPTIGTALRVHPQNLRTLIWGGSAFAIVLCAAGSERALGHYLPRWSQAIGDASYAIYLTHSLFLPALCWPIGKVGLSPVAALAALCILGTSGSILIGLLAHRLIEQRLVTGLRPVFIANQR